jgi:hypothetical protein
MRRPSYAAIVAHVALAVALSGGALAAATIDGASIKKGTVTGATVKDGSLTGADVKAYSIPLNRLSKSLPKQYYSRAQSDARFLAAGGKAVSAGTADTATTATNATNAVNAQTATNATQLGGLPASAYAKGAVTTLANRMDFPVGTPTVPIILTVPGVLSVQLLNCLGSGANVQVNNLDAASSLVASQNNGTPFSSGPGWSSASSPFTATSTFDAVISLGTGATTKITHLSVAVSVIAGSTCEYVVKAEIYG